MLYASFALRATLDGMIARQSFEIPGLDPAPGQRGVSVDVSAVDHGYFAALGIPILEGWPFSEADRRGATGVAIVNQDMARRF